MKALKSIKVLLYFPFILSLCCCVPEKITLLGDIRGTLTDAESSEPLQEASVKLNQSSNPVDTTFTGNNGSYLLKNLAPGNYEIQASKKAYKKITEYVTVASGTTTEMNFDLSRAPFPLVVPDTLDFGVDSTNRSFTISNAGLGELRYQVFSSKDWITVDREAGEVTTEADPITVTIDRTGLSKKKHNEYIRITYSDDEEIQEVIVKVFVNGMFDIDNHYYGIVKIGTQTWMAENVNSGYMILFNGEEEPRNNGVIEKFCVDDNTDNCDIYGGLYQWDELMDYHPPDTGTIGITQGICPAGWHIPTRTEWLTLADYLGGPDVAGIKLKETGTIEGGDGLWSAFPNVEATNESGFSARPGGYVYFDHDDPDYDAGFYFQKEVSYFWSASGGGAAMYYKGDMINIGDAKVLPDYDVKLGKSLRCIKDPE